MSNVQDNRQLQPAPPATGARKVQPDERRERLLAAARVIGSSYSNWMARTAKSRAEGGRKRSEIARKKREAALQRRTVAYHITETPVCA